MRIDLSNSARKSHVTARAKNESTLEKTRQEAKHCRACPLWKIGTQTVFGEGPEHASIMLVGEQPGDQEDIHGRPFVGPAGRLLDQALQSAGLNRKELYVTNAVKHFKHELRGKRRLHKPPAQREILACNQWLQRELEIVKPTLIVAMGGTAARAVFGRAMPIQENRGRIHIVPQKDSPMELNNTGWKVLVTVHPSYLLRVLPPDREAALAQFVKDLSVATAAAQQRRSVRAIAH